jgi:hypothetical protein
MNVRVRCLSSRAHAFLSRIKSDLSRAIQEAEAAAEKLHDALIIHGTRCKLLWGKPMANSGGAQPRPSGADGTVPAASSTPDYFGMPSASYPSMDPNMMGSAVAAADALAGGGGQARPAIPYPMAGGPQLGMGHPAMMGPPPPMFFGGPPGMPGMGPPGMGMMPPPPGSFGPPARLHPHPAAGGMPPGPHVRPPGVGGVPPTMGAATHGGVPPGLPQGHPQGGGPHGAGPWLAAEGGSNGCGLQGVTHIPAGGAGSPSPTGSAPTQPAVAAQES